MGGPRDEGTLNTVLVGSLAAALVRREGYYRLAARADTHRRTAAQKGGVVANRNPFHLTIIYVKATHCCVYTQQKREQHAVLLPPC